MKAFTLIEVLVYLGLVSILLYGALTSAFAIESVATHTETRAVVFSESEFLMQKITYSVAHSDAVIVPSEESTTSLLVLRSGNARLEYRVADGVIQLVRDNRATPLVSVNTTSHLSVSRHDIEGAPGYEYVDITLALASRGADGRRYTASTTRRLFLP